MSGGCNETASDACASQLGLALTPPFGHSQWQVDTSRGIVDPRRESGDHTVLRIPTRVSTLH
jgi:hypothetical protein